MQKSSPLFACKKSKRFCPHSFSRLCFISKQSGQISILQWGHSKSSISIFSNGNLQSGQYIHWFDAIPLSNSSKCSPKISWSRKFIVWSSLEKGSLQIGQTLKFSWDFAREKQYVRMHSMQNKWLHDKTISFPWVGQVWQDSHF